MAPGSAQGTLNGMPVSYSTGACASLGGGDQTTATSSASLDNSGISSSSNELINELFKTLNLDANNTISVNDAELLLKRLNTRLGKRFEEEESRQFFDTVEINQNGRIDVNYFRRIFEQQLSIQGIRGIKEIVFLAQYIIKITRDQ